MTTEKIATSAVTSVTIDSSAVVTNKIANGAVTAAKLASNISVLRLGDGYAGGDTIITGTFDFDTTYTTGGQLESLATTLTNGIKSLMIVPSKDGLVFEVDETSFTTGQYKVKVFQTGDSTAAPLGELPNDSLAASQTTGVRFEAIGRP